MASIRPGRSAPWCWKRYEAVYLPIDPCRRRSPPAPLGRWPELSLTRIASTVLALGLPGHPSSPFGAMAGAGSRERQPVVLSPCQPAALAAVAAASRSRGICCREPLPDSRGPPGGHPRAAHLHSGADPTVASFKLLRRLGAAEGASLYGHRRLRPERFVHHRLARGTGRPPVPWCMGRATTTSKARPGQGPLTRQLLGRCRPRPMG